MKVKTLITALLFSIICSSSALQAATLTIHTSGSLKKADYLCIYEVGCFNLNMAAHGKKFNVDTMDLTQLKKLALVNMGTHVITTAAVNSSCTSIDAKDKQAVTINIKVGSDGHADSTIQHSVCKVTG